MSYFGEQVEERRRFTKEERHAILMRNSCRCCTCNKKLTDKTMTVEHIIPISRGGTNDIKNLIPLCGKSLREEVESVCGISLSDAASYYVLKKRTSDKLLLLLKVEYENDVLRFIVLWNDILSLKVLSTILWSIAYHTNGRFKILNIPLDGFVYGSMAVNCVVLSISME